MIRRASLAILLMTAAMSAASAADYIPLPPPEPEFVPSYSGWYIRGDLGYVFESETHGYYKSRAFKHGHKQYYDTYYYDEIRLDQALMIGGGVGYQYNEFLRFDATVNYFDTDVKGRSECPTAIALGFGAECAFDDKASADVWTIMANTYVDVFTAGRFTGYLGAGLGFASVDYGDMKNDIVCKSGYCAGDVLFTGVHKGVQDWRFASSLHAGASFDLTAQLKLDAGYTYTRIAKGDAFEWDQFDKAAGESGVQGKDDGFNVHTLRAGLRYNFF